MESADENESRLDTPLVNPAANKDDSEGGASYDIRLQKETLGLGIGLLSAYFWINRSAAFNFASAIYSILVLVLNIGILIDTSYLNFVLSLILLPFEIMYAFRMMRFWRSVGLTGELTTASFRFSSYNNHMIQMIFISQPILCLQHKHLMHMNVDYDDNQFDNNCKYSTIDTVINASKIFVHVYFLVFMIANEYTNKNLWKEIVDEVDKSPVLTLFMLVLSYPAILFGFYRQNDYMVMFDDDVVLTDELLQKTVDTVLHVIFILPTCFCLNGYLAGAGGVMFLFDCVTLNIFCAFQRFQRRCGYQNDIHCYYECLDRCDGCGFSYDFALMIGFHSTVCPVKFLLLLADELTMSALNLNITFNRLLRQQSVYHIYCNSRYFGVLSMLSEDKAADDRFTLLNSDVQ
jgi:hypothetical protein